MDTAPPPAPESFVLTISAEETTMPQGEGFRINIELKNNSGKCHEITHCGFGLFLLNAGRSEWHPFDDPAVDPPEPVTRIFETDSVIRCSLHGGAALEPGTHSLQVSANFWLSDSGEEITAWSDIITVVVTEGVFKLTISAEETIVTQSENFKINIELKNNSGESHEMRYFILFWPRIPRWSPVEGMQGSPGGSFEHTNTIIFEADNMIRNLVTSYERGQMRNYLVFCYDEDKPWIINTSRLEPGMHELQFSAGFSIRENEGGQWWRVVILSNPIILTIE